MLYTTLQALLDRFNTEEIAQRADRGTPRLVTAALLTISRSWDAVREGVAT